MADANEALFREMVNNLQKEITMINSNLKEQFVKLGSDIDEKVKRFDKHVESVKSEIQMHYATIEMVREVEKKNDIRLMRLEDFVDFLRKLGGVVGLAIITGILGRLAKLI